MSELPAPEMPARSALRRWLPLAIIVVLSVTALAIGWNRKISFETLVRHNDAVHGFILAHRLASIGIYIVIYMVGVALSLPVGLVLTMSGGFLLGGLAGGAAAVVGATIGAAILFMIAKSAFGEHLTRRAGPAAERLAEGFRADAFHYLLFLRLVPVFPFFVINLVAAIVGVRLSTFLAATAVGIIPATFTFAFLGAGLDSVIRAQGAVYNACLASGRADCKLDFDIKAAVTPEMLGALAALGVLALIPVAVKRIRARRTAASS
ncbi:MAG: VTT domain-containing protein [Xanthobacteraceae bacterium]|nr:VTT domain-containing protein [Xanthobacteraceae bacterium]